VNQKIIKTREELERTKAKITELQALIPEFERKIRDMEDTEIVRLIRSANIAPVDLPEIIKAIKTTGAPPPGSPLRKIPQTNGSNAKPNSPEEDDINDV
jgi:hypothetical protein